MKFELNEKVIVLPAYYEGEATIIGLPIRYSEKYQVKYDDYDGMVSWVEESHLEKYADAKLKVGSTVLVKSVPFYPLPEKEMIGHMFKIKRRALGGDRVYVDPTCICCNETFSSRDEAFEYFEVEEIEQKRETYQDILERYGIIKAK